MTWPPISIDIDALTYFDFAVLFVIGISAFMALMRGFTYEIIALLGLALAAYGTYILSPFLLPLVQNYLRPNWLIQTITMLGAFFVLALISSLIAQRISILVLQNRISLLDRVLGLGYGVIRGTLLVALAWLGLTLLINEQRLPDWVTNAQTLPVIRETAQAILRQLPTQFLPERPDVLAQLPAWLCTNHMVLKFA